MVRLDHIQSSFEKAAKDYILWLDADDTFLDREKEKLQGLKMQPPATINAVTMDYNLKFDSAGYVTFAIKRNRIVKRDRAFKWIGAVYKYLQVAGSIYHSDVAVSHKSLRHDTNRNRYDRLDNYKKAYEHNEIVREFQPNNKDILSNKQ